MKIKSRDASFPFAQKAAAASCPLRTSARPEGRLPWSSCVTLHLKLSGKTPPRGGALSEAQMEMVTNRSLQSSLSGAQVRMAPSGAGNFNHGDTAAGLGTREASSLRCAGARQLCRRGRWYAPKAQCLLIAVICHQPTTNSVQIPPPCDPSKGGRRIPLT